MSRIAPYAKSVIAAVLAALSVLGGYLVNNTSLGDITAGQWVTVAAAGLVALAAVFTVPNATSGGGA